MRLKRYYSAWSRYHKSNGYGIHSPFAFSFVLNVLRERLPYYSYEYIHALRHEVIEHARHHARHPRIISLKNAKLMFRLANYFNPSAILQVGTSYGISSACMLAVSKKTRLYLCEPNLAEYPITEKVLETYGSQVLTFPTLPEGLQRYKENATGQPFILVNDIVRDDYDEILQYLLSVCRANGVIVMRNISRHPIMHDLWKACKDYSATGMTFTNEKIAIIVASPKLPQQDFYLWF